jgi:hypothetical protein
MAPNISIPTLESKIKSTMPVALAAQFEPLFKEIMWLTAKWSEFLKLYAADKETIDLINRSAGYFFVIVQDTLWDDVLLHLTRLSGPARTGKNKNLSIFQFPLLVDSDTLRAKLESLLNERDEVFAFADRHRNKRLAHHDLAVAITGISSVPGSSRLQIRKAIQFLQDYARVIYAHYTDTDFIFERFDNTHDANRLLRLLRKVDAGSVSER